MIDDKTKEEDDDVLHEQLIRGADGKKDYGANKQHKIVEDKS